jgi:cyanophycin synthetase
MLTYRDSLTAAPMITPSEIEKVRVGKFSISTSLLIRTALRMGLRCAFLPEKVVQISDGKTTHYFKGTSLPCNNTVASNLSCNKYFLRRLLKAENLPTPRTITLRHPAAWQAILRSSLRFPLVVKPINASHAKGASLNITSPDELRQAVARAFAYIRKYKQGDRVLVEEYVSGHDLRLLVIGDRVASVVKREPAYVVGNGHRTVRQLIHDFSDKWRSPIKYDLPLCPIPIDSEVSRCLAKSGLTINTVPAEGQKVYVRWNANVSTGGRPTEVTDLVHPRLKNLAVRVAKLSHLEIGGVDMLCKDLASGDVSDNNVSILEINDCPGFDIHHFPVTGTGRDVSAAILNHIFEKPRQEEEPSAAQIESLLQNLQLDVPAPVTYS